MPVLKLCRHTVYMVLAWRCVLYGSQKRQRLLLYTSLTGWFL